MPVHQNLLLRTPEEARAVARGDLGLRACMSCGLLWNAAFRPELLSYGPQYDSNQTCSAVFDGYVESLIDALVANGVRGMHVVEVGCGRGYFLARLCAKGDSTGSGFDPAYAGPSTSDDGRVRYFCEPFEPSRAPQADVIVCRHVIEHVADPTSLLRAIRAALRPSPRSAVYFETPALEWILENVAFWDFFYEHCNYFTAEALANASRVAGLAPLLAWRTFGGQYQWLMSKVAGVEAVKHPKSLSAAQKSYTAAEHRRVLGLQAMMDRFAAGGGLAVWGAAAKGVTFANLIDSDATRVKCLIDVNPAKYGHFVAGTGHRIVAPQDARGLGVTDVVAMNPAYLAEIRGMVSRLDASMRVHSLEE